MTQHGFRVLEVPELLPAADKRFQWRRVNAFDFAIETHPNCPIDGTPMETIAALVSLTLPERVDIGACPRCGIVGYIDRPSEADIDRYYAETWMGETVADARAIARSRQASPDSAQVELLKSLHLGPHTPVLEIGCGYGSTIEALRRAGLYNIDATEHCPARAEAVRQVFGVNVTTEIPDKRYGLIVSHHVLEHCCDPAALIGECAKRQESGDWMIHSLPNFGGEPSMGVLLFLPHLWSFWRGAFADLLSRNSYLPTDESKHSESGLFFVCKKDGALVHADTCELYPELLTMPGRNKPMVDKLLRGLGLVPQRSILAWQVGVDGVAWLPHEHGNGFTRHIVAERLTEGFVSGAPIEVQFSERVQAFIK